MSGPFSGGSRQFISTEGPMTSEGKQASRPNGRVNMDYRNRAYTVSFQSETQRGRPTSHYDPYSSYSRLLKHSTDSVDEDFDPYPMGSRVRSNSADRYLQNYHRTSHLIQSRNIRSRSTDSTDFQAGIYPPDADIPTSYLTHGVNTSRVSQREVPALWRADSPYIALPYAQSPNGELEDDRDQANSSHRQITALLPFSFDLEDYSTGRIIKRSQNSVATGAFGDVYEGLWDSGSEILKVAIKSIRLSPNTEKERKKIAKKLRREVIVWQKLHHPNVLELLGTTSGFGSYPSLVSPWAENGNLNTYLEHRGEGLALAERLEILYGASNGLVYLHSCDVIHGDLSGANILIDGNGRALLSDFGLSVIVPKFLGTSYLTSSIRGTLRWSAPEVYSEEGGQGKSTTTRFSDVYSLGSLMLQTFSGKVPYYPKDEIQVISAVFRGVRPARPTEQEAPLLSDMHWNLIQNCWAEKPEERPDPEQAREFWNTELRKLTEDIFIQKRVGSPVILGPSVSAAVKVHGHSPEFDREAYQDPESYVVYSQGTRVDVDSLLEQDEMSPRSSDYRYVRHIPSESSQWFPRTPTTASDSIESAPSPLQRRHGGLDGEPIQAHLSPHRGIELKRSYSAEFYGADKSRDAYSPFIRDPYSREHRVSRHEENIPWRIDSRSVQRSLYNLPRDSLQLATSYAFTPEPKYRKLVPENSTDSDQYPEVIHGLLTHLGQPVPQQRRNTPHASPVSSRSIRISKLSTSPARSPRDRSMQRNDAKFDRTSTHDHHDQPRDSRLTLRRGSWESVPVMREEREYQTLSRQRSLPYLPHPSTDLISSSNNPSGRYPIAATNARIEPESTNPKGRPVRLSQICRQLKQHVRAIRISVSKLFKGHSK